MKTLFEKVIALSAAFIIGLAVFFGGITILGYRSVITSKDKVIAVQAQDVAAVDKLKLYDEEKSSEALHYLMTGNPRPYLDRMNTARNNFLSLLRSLREQVPAVEAKRYLDKIEQTEMDQQIYLNKAIDSRHSGPNYIGISLTLQNLVQPKHDALKKALNEFSDFKTKQIRASIENSLAEANGSSVRVARIVAASAVTALTAAGLTWLLIVQMLYKRRKRERIALESEEKLRTGLDAAEVVTWQRNLLTDTFDKNMRHLRLYGFTKDPPIWNFETFLRTIHTDDRNRVKAALVQAITEGSDYSIEFRVKWPDKSTHHILSKGKIYMDEENKPVKMVGFDTNIDKLRIPPVEKDEFDTYVAPKPPTATVVGRHVSSTTEP